MLQASSGLICSFSPGGDALAVATADGRVRTYDSGTGRLRATLGLSSSGQQGANATISNGFLIESHTCLAWVGGRKDKSKKKSGSNAVVLGTAAGDVKSYDTQLGELHWRAKDVIQGGVTAVAVSSSGDNVIYATGAGRQVVALDATTGEVKSKFEASKHALSCLAISPDSTTAFCGGSGLALWDLSAQEKKAKFTGHATPAHSAVFVPDGRHAVSAAEGERHVAVWSTVPPPVKKAKKSQPAVASLSLDDPAAQLDTCQAASLGGETGSFHVAAVSEAGEAYVWSCQQGEGDQAVQARLLARVRVGGAPTKGAAAGAEECILAVKLQPGTQGPLLLVARGNSAKPVFEKVAVPEAAAADGPAPTISLQPAENGLLLEGAKKGDAKAKLAHTRDDVTVLGPENLGQPVMVRVGITGSDGPVGASGRKRLEPEPEVAVPEEEEVPDLPDDEVPLGQRVATMEERANMPGNIPGEEEEAGPSGQGLPQGSSKTDSLAVLLTQALRSNDRALLEKCLASSSQKIITNTVRRLLPMDAALFLRAAVDRVLSKPARAVQLAPWIKAIMHYHTGYLMTAPAVQGSLAALYQAIDSRVSLYQQLLKVYGRLTLITAHTAQQAEEQAGEEGGVADDGLPEPEVVFEDGSDEEPDAEDPFAPEGLSDEEGDEEDGEGLDDDDDDLMSDGGEEEDDEDDDEDDE